MKNDFFGDRLKEYEARETSRKFFKQLPVYARIDGRGFSKLTKNLARPYDETFAFCMINTTKALVEKTNAKIGYTQSDEISLAWLIDNEESEMFFDGKIQKLCSVLSSMATSYFITNLLKSPLQDLINQNPHFDCRVFQLPTETEATNCFVWREQDATKNAISMAARAYFSHKQLQGKNSKEMIDMLWEKGINFNEYPTFFRRGTYCRKQYYNSEIGDDIWNKIPENKKPSTRSVIRSCIDKIDMPIITKVTNRNDVIFRGLNPIIGD